eukprot:Selendium_serpulae@DN5671_c0_g1_i2.p1
MPGPTLEANVTVDAVASASAKGRTLAKTTFKPDEKFRKEWEEILMKSQDYICDALSNLDGKKFSEDKYERKTGGWGRTRVLQEGNVFEKGGVGIAIVHGTVPASAAHAMTGLSDIEWGKNGEYKFYGAGLSMVIHTKNPFAPTSHQNYRFFQLFDGETGESISWWFGGGSDLTPSYIINEDAIHFHKTLKNVYDKYDTTWYPRFKEWADEYYVNTHRKEARGIGGTFFDRLNDREPEKLREFAAEGLKAYIDAYVPIVTKRKDTKFTEENRRFQQLRRGRYVEFNIMHDRGTKFGLQVAEPRVESILMTLPLTARWEYQPDETLGKEEKDSLEIFRNAKDWLQIKSK